MTGTAAFLAAVADQRRPVLPERVVLVVAHPDDETLGCGALLPRLADVTVIHVTDGAPRDGRDAERYGFASPDAYADARRAELADAMALAGVPADRLRHLDVPDQAAMRCLAQIARRLMPHLAGRDLVLTHAFEGGHPDHDATAFAVHAAAALLEPERRPAVVEMPFYHAGPEDGGAILRQVFADPAGETVLRLTGAERRHKAGMLAAHASQAETLGPFGVADERFRPAGTIDFLVHPNGGRVLYESFGWGLDGDAFRERAGLALTELGLGAPA